MTENQKIVKKYFNKYFKEQYYETKDQEFQSLVRILNKKDKQVKNNIALGNVGKRTVCPKIETCKVTPHHCACDMGNEYVC